MKKIVAILMLSLFVFNHFGYRLVFNYMQQQADLQMQASLDKDDYSDDGLITLTVPLSMPYQNNQQHFERVDGEIKVDGKIYKYVKRKISDGNLVLLCVPDQNKMRITSAKDEFFKYANDLVQGNHSRKSDQSKSGIFKNVLSDYDAYSNKFSIPTFSNGQQTYSGCPASILLINPHAAPWQPPRLS